MGHSFESFRRHASCATNDKDRTRFTFTFCENGCETTRGLNRTDQAADFDMGRDSRVHDSLRQARDIRAGSTAGFVTA